ncbi:MAG: hypothetical protein GY856_23570, partial [bacterium]|nr:hypothetical protein [bacterium]
MLMARQALVGPGPDGRAGYQVAMTVCESCQQGFQEARGELVPVAEEVVEMALCDPQLIGHVDGSPCPSSECGCGKTGSTHTHVGTSDGDGDGGDTHVGTSDGDGGGGVTHVGMSQPPAAPTIPSRPPRATQTIAPAVARTVRRRQRGRCAAPGCRCSIYL